MLVINETAELRQKHVDDQNDICADSPPASAPVGSNEGASDANGNIVLGKDFKIATGAASAVKAKRLLDIRILV